MRKLLPTLTLFLLFGAASASAADITLTAEEKVEWHSNSQKIVAVGNAVATKENMKIQADKLIGHYLGKNSASEKGRIKRVEAVGKVDMVSDTTHAYGDSLDYDVSKDTAVLKGKPAKIATPKETITADDNITYYMAEQKAVASGNVTAISNDNRLTADLMVAYFAKGSDAKSGMELDKVEIFNNIKIKTPDADVVADKGIYYPKTEKVKLFHNVTITQNGNSLSGDQAETDLRTGISQMTAGTKKGRVTGVFKEKKKTGNKDAATKQEGH